MRMARAIITLVLVVRLTHVSVVENEDGKGRHYTGPSCETHPCVCGRE